MARILKNSRVIFTVKNFQNDMSKNQNNDFSCFWQAKDKFSSLFKTQSKAKVIILKGKKTVYRFRIFFSFLLVYKIYLFQRQTFALLKRMHATKVLWDLT